MDSIIFSPMGWVHTVSAVLALISGTWVILTPKGTVRHRTVGYMYVGAMLLMLASSFSIFHLFGAFGPFHLFAIISTLTLLGGMGPILFKRRFPNWLEMHYQFMSWSTVGLYAAFVAETGVRFFPLQYFGWVVGILVFGISFLGGRVIKSQKGKIFRHIQRSA